MHPGEVLREDLLPHFGLTPGDLAERTGIDAAIVEAVLAERRKISPALAERLGAAFGLEPRYWLALQKQYDLWHAYFDGETKRRARQASLLEIA